EALTKEPTGETPEQIEPGEWIYSRVFHRSWEDPRWIGPFQVVSSTTYSVKVWLDDSRTKVSKSWHKSHCRKGEPSFERDLREIRKHLRDIGEEVEE
ncbi:hypothetical protein ATANTOWER_013056, partial [Ataeniobius toweri]|nr:hypothetical protein [Ataeniobius toweri]